MTTSPGATTYTENDANTPVAVDPGLTLPIRTPHHGRSHRHHQRRQTGDKLTYTPAAGSLIHLQGGSTDTRLVLVGPGTPADYEAALQSITFVSPGDNPVAGERTVGFSVNDDRATPTPTPKPSPSSPSTTPRQ